MFSLCKDQHRPGTIPDVRSLDMATAFEKQGVRRVSHMSENEQSPLNLPAIVMADEYLAWLVILSF